METYFITFDFAEDTGYSGPLTLQQALEEHPQIKNFFADKSIIQLAANSFILKTEMNMDAIYSSLVSFIDRFESVSVFRVEIDGYVTFAQPEVREALGNLLEVGID